MEEFDINAKDDIYFNNFIFQNNIWNFFKLFLTALISASGNGHTEKMKILVFNHLTLHTEIMKMEVLLKKL